MRFFRKLGKKALGVLYPELCPVCGQALASGEQTLCLHCRWDMPWTGYAEDPENPVFRQLHGDIPQLQRAAALFFFHHESHYRSAIHSLKYSGRRDIARSFGEILGRELKESGLYDDVDLLVPVPLHWTKRIRRGYNQAEEICRGVSKSLGPDCDFRSLKRTRRTRSQALHKTRADRHRNVEGAFTVRRPDRLHDRHILLVDDVLTTGATIKACAEAIRQALGDEVRISVATLSTVKPQDRNKK